MNPSSHLRPGIRDGRAASGVEAAQEVTDDKVTASLDAQLGDEGGVYQGGGDRGNIHVSRDDPCLLQGDAGALDGFLLTLADGGGGQVGALQLTGGDGIVELGLLNDGSSAIPAPESPQVLVAWLQLTNACNLRCGYCYIQRSGESMSVATAQDAVDAVIRAALQHGYPVIALKYAGGEASLRMDLVEQTHRYAQAQVGKFSSQGC